MQGHGLKKVNGSKNEANTVPHNNDGARPSEAEKAQRVSERSEHDEKTPMVDRRVMELMGSIISTASSDNDSDESGRKENLLPKQQTNRQAYGTWNRDFDFTLTCIGYVIGLSNFFRFPFICYKFGTIPFLIVYTIVVVFVGIPLIFMEITIGQFGGVGSISAFRQLAPILTGVSYILAWSSFINCWLTGSMLSWIRVYSGASLSCLKGWQGCFSDHFYNTPMCWTGRLENCCGYRQHHDCPESTRNFTKTVTEKNDGIVPESIYYNFQCMPTEDFCKLFDWKHTGRKECTDAAGKTHSVFERREHASIEYLHGFVFGLRSRMTYLRRKAVLKECRRYFKEKGKDPKKYCKRKRLYESPAIEYKQIRDKIATDKAVLKHIWSQPNNKELYMDPESSSYLSGPILAFTTVLFITIFLFDNLLRVSAVQYIFNGIPFCLFFYMLGTSFQFDYSDVGVYKLFEVNLELIKNFGNPEMWVEAVVQVLATTGVGNGALISLASFNKYQHRYMFDVLLIVLLNIVMSLSATALCFCTIANYIKAHNVASLPFEKFVPMENGITSSQFGFVVYSIFVMHLDYRKKDIQILLFFIMFSSFPSDTAIRLAQCMFDAAVHVLPRLRHHPTMALIAVVSFYYLSLLPVTQQSGAYIFTHFENYTLRFAIPSIVLIEVLSVSYVYKAQQLLENAQHLGVIGPGKFSKFLLISLKYVSPVFLGLTLIGSIYVEIMRQVYLPFKQNTMANVFGVWFSLVPILMIVLTVAKQLAACPRAKWPELFKTVNLHEAQTRVSKSKRGNTATHSERLTMNPERPSIMPTDQQPPKKKSHKKSEIARELMGNLNHKGTHLRQSAAAENRSNEGSTTGSSSSAAAAASKPLKDKTISFDEGPKNPTDDTDEYSSVDSAEVSTWQKYIFWTELANHFEDWPDRLDETDFESEGSSDDSEGGLGQAKVFHVHYPVKEG